ncbi:DUF7691 family protein [Streptomyces abikoensis]|uniref:DUF7691 family protein n=1 Tax=Streptomyces abikoensis TaxID=97398 RepID=UPI0036A42703
MSHNIWYSTADKADILAFLGSNGNVPANQQRRLAEMRTSAQVYQAELVRQDVDWGLPVPEALEHLIAGHTECDTEYAGNAYHAAMQIIIDQNASDPAHLGTYSRPATFFSYVGEVMQSLGVPAELLPYGFFYPTTLPGGFPYIPHSADVYPAIGHMPLAKAKPAADAYRAILDQLDPSTRYDIQELIDKLDLEHEHWVYGTEKLDWYTQDTLFLALT